MWRKTAIPKDLPHIQLYQCRRSCGSDIITCERSPRHLELPDINNNLLLVSVFSLEYTMKGFSWRNSLSNFNMESSLQPTGEVSGFMTGISPFLTWLSTLNPEFSEFSNTKNLHEAVASLLEPILIIFLYLVELFFDGNVRIGGFRLSTLSDLKC